MNSFDVIVVGLGAMGSATTYQLARRGTRVCGIDMFDPPHELGSSHGETRVTRCGVGEGPQYVPLAIRSHEIWRELERDEANSLLLQCGFLAIDAAPGEGTYHGRRDFFGSTVSGAAAFNVEHELLDAAEAMHRFPQLMLSGAEQIYFEPGGGLVYPERCISAQLRAALTLGADLHPNERVLSIDFDVNGVAVTTPEGRYQAEKVVIAAGGWTPGIAGGVLRKMRLLRQVLHWFEPEPQWVRSYESFPTFIWTFGRDGNESFYGFPIVPDGTPGVKVAREQYETEITAPEQVSREVPGDESKLMFESSVRGRLAGVTGVSLKHATCFYTYAPDSDFVIDWHPGNDRMLIVSACSGHGFKHSAAIGELAARMVLEGGETVPEFQAMRPALLSD